MPTAFQSSHFNTHCKSSKGQNYIFTLLKTFCKHKYGRTTVSKVDKTEAKVNLAKGSWINSKFYHEDIQNNQ